MRSNLGTHFAGTGMRGAFVEKEESYKDNNVNVRLANDPAMMESEEFDRLCEKLSGEVKTYYLEKGDK